MADKGRNIVDINPDRLDEECITHARRTLDACEDEADAKHELAKAKSRLDVIEAQLQIDIRKDPEKFNLPKDLKEAGIKAAVFLHKDYRTASKDVDDSQHQVHLTTAKVSALTEKRRMIERLVELRQIDYYSEPRPRGKASREYVEEGTKKQTREGIRPRKRDDD